MKKKITKKELINIKMALLKCAIIQKENNNLEHSKAFEELLVKLSDGQKYDI